MQTHVITDFDKFYSILSSTSFSPLCVNHGCDRNKLLRTMNFPGIFCKVNKSHNSIILIAFASRDNQLLVLFIALENWLSKLKLWNGELKISVGIDRYDMCVYGILKLYIDAIIIYKVATWNLPNLTLYDLLNKFFTVFQSSKFKQTILLTNFWSTMIILFRRLRWDLVNFSIYNFLF